MMGGVPSQELRAPPRDFQSLRESSGLPEPRITGLGDVVTAAIKAPVGGAGPSPSGPSGVA